MSPIGGTLLRALLQLLIRLIVGSFVNFAQLSHRVFLRLTCGLQRTLFQKFQIFGIVKKNMLMLRTVHRVDAA